MIGGREEVTGGCEEYLSSTARLEKWAFGFFFFADRANVVKCMGECYARLVVLRQACHHGKIRDTCINWLLK